MEWVNDLEEVTEIDIPCEDVSNAAEEPDIDAIDYHTYIRDNVKKQVDDCYWLADVKKMYSRIQEKMKESEAQVRDKCVVCTLPFGTCEHTSNWRDDMMLPRYTEEELDRMDPPSYHTDFFSSKPDTKNATSLSPTVVRAKKVEDEIDEALGLVGGRDINDDLSQQLASKPSPDDEIDMNNIRWTQTVPRASDKLGDSYLVLSAPSERGWHTCTVVGKQYIVVFGGYRYKKKCTPDSFGVSASAAGVVGDGNDLTDIQYLSDIHVFDTENGSWHCPVTSIVENVFDTKPAPETVDEDDVLYDPNVMGKVSKGPPGRYGHVAAALDDSRLMIFGGRGSNGRFMNDTWVYNIHTATWYECNYNKKKPPAACEGAATIISSNSSTIKSAPFSVSPQYRTPSPRVFSACAAIETERTSTDLSVTRLFRQSYQEYSSGDPEKAATATKATGQSIVPDAINSVYMFGGTDGSDVLSDMWVFRGHLAEMHWDNIISVGVPPAPRYGHKMIYNPQDGNIVIMGGCAVGPYSEIVAGGGDALSVAKQQKRLFDLSSSLQRSYVAEGEIAAHGGVCLMDNIVDEDMDTNMPLRENSLTSNSLSGLSFDPGHHPGSTVKELTTQAAHISATVQSQEAESRKLELELADAHYLAQADKVFRQHYKAKHPMTSLDIYFLDTRHHTWKPQIYPPITGLVPTARMHFGAMLIGNWLVITGGSVPTSLFHSTADFDHAGQASNICLYALNMHTMVWSRPIPIENTESLIIPLQIAESDITRARYKIQEEKERAKALGARRGRTVQLAEAEAVLEVCEWRKSMLLQEQNELIPSPANCFGATFTRIGQRGLLLGGWGNQAAINTGKYLLMLDLEVEHEKRRRLDDEFHAKLERDRLLENQKSFLEKLQSNYELRAMIAMEKLNMKRENREMYIEDIRSSLPPLTKPKKVIKEMCNHHTIWVSWERATTDAYGQPLRVHKHHEKEQLDGTGSVDHPHHKHHKHSDDVIYRLYARTAYVPLSVDQRVLVYGANRTSALAKKKPSAVSKSEEDAKESKSDEESEISNGDEVTALTTSVMNMTIEPGMDDIGTMDVEDILQSRQFFESICFDPPNIMMAKYSDKISRFSGDIIKNHHNGYFDIAYDDGGYEYNVSRMRLRPDTVYGADCLPANASKLAQKRMKSKLLRRYRRRKAYEKRMAKAKHKHGKRLFTPGTASSTRPGTRANAVYSGDGEVPFSRPVPAQPKSDGLQGTEPPLDRVQTAGVELPVTIEENSGAFGETESSMSSESSESDSDFSDYSSESDGVAHPHYQERPHEQLYSKLHIDPETFKPTVRPDPSVWYLVYIGKDTKYACAGVLSDSVLAEEPNLTVPVAFMVQTCGTEFPKEEYSLCSDPLVVWTKIPEVVNIHEENGNYSPTASHASWNSTVSPMDSKIGSPTKTTGKKKKSDRYRYAEIPGHGEIEIERQHHTYLSSGISDYYM